MMMRGFQIALIFIIIWLSVVLLSGPIEEPIRGLNGNRSAAIKPTIVAPIVTPRSEISGPLPQEELAQPRAEHYCPEETWPSSAKKDGGRSFRAPVQVATLIKQKNLEEVIKKYAQEYGVDEDLIWAVIRQESGFNPGAVSPKGAMGLMQLMPGTAALMGVSNPFDVEQNIAGGVKYLEQCLNQFNQDVPSALAAYNAGPANVVKFQGCPPFAETRNYVASILQAYAGEPIRADLKLCRVNYIIDADPPVPSRLKGLPWRIPLPNWKIATPQNKLASPRWKVALSPF
jgi:soluble lytic murein transglycosylase-like protein